MGGGVSLYQNPARFLWASFTILKISLKDQLVDVGNLFAYQQS